MIAIGNRLHAFQQAIDGVHTLPLVKKEWLKSDLLSLGSL